MNDTTRAAAKTICALSGDFCRLVGGDLGCMAGRGVMPTAEACIATDAQLMLKGYIDCAERILALPSARLT